MNEESLFAAALQKASVAERRAFLDEACAGDAGLRQRLERLLAADAETAGVLDQGQNAAAVLGAYRPEPPLAAEQLFAGRFRLLRKLGEGGMGEVWLANQQEPVRRQVALKVIRQGLGSERLAGRFEAERQALALMDHPNIARVFDAGVAEGRPFFVMELIQGAPITQFCDALLLTPRQRLELFVPVCAAVQHAHQKGVIHRDLKPSNVLVALCDGRPVPRVIDFGVAKATGPRLGEDSFATEVGALVGTLEYMSPEQAELGNQDIDTRSDVYSLGVLLYELLTGTVPFPRERLRSAPLAEALRLIKEVEPPRPSARLSEPGAPPWVAEARQAGPKKLREAVRGELDWVVMRCLEKDPARRYETASGLARDIQRYLNEEPVEACPPSAGYRLRKFVRRHWRALGAASAFVLLLVTAVVTLTVALVVVNWERQEKEAALKAEGRRRKQARAALDAMSSGIIEEWLGQQKELRPEHKRFLELALRHYEEFAADTGQDEEARAGVANAYSRVGVIRRRLGQRKDAEAALERGRELYAALAADFPGAPGYRRDLAQAYYRLSLVYTHTRQAPKAEVALRESLSILRGLAAEFPAVPDDQGSVAMTLNNLGILLKNTGQAREAEKAFAEALAIMKPLADQFPSEPRYQGELARIYSNLGVLLDVHAGRSRKAGLQDPRPSQEAAKAFAEAVAVYERLLARFPKERRYLDGLAISRDHLAGTLRDAERYPEAEKVFHQALATRERLVAEFPGVPEHRRGLAITLNNLGILLKNTDRPGEAEELYRQSLDVHKKLAADFPDDAEHQNSVAGAMVNLARLLLEGKDPDGARRLLEEALPYHRAALKAFPRHPAYRNFYRNNRWRMTETLLELKDHAAAAETAGEFLAAAVDPPRDAYTAACLLAGCVRLAAEDERLPEGKRQELARAYGDRALAALRQAVAKGAKEVAQMKTDKGLDPLRPRGDFEKLLAGLEAKSKP
jgi:tetratricopeptide (TPR) repeat protein/tRNA A-37 threonylcarbamoyl transferase component Bud32